MTKLGIAYFIKKIGSTIFLDAIRNTGSTNNSEIGIALSDSLIIVLTNEVLLTDLTVPRYYLASITMP